MTETFADLFPMIIIVMLNIGQDMVVINVVSDQRVNQNELILVQITVLILVIFVCI